MGELETTTLTIDKKLSSGQLKLKISSFEILVQKKSKLTITVGSNVLYCDDLKDFLNEGIYIVLKINTKYIMLQKGNRIYRRVLIPGQDIVYLIETI